jgi:hypothetical protein
MFFRELFDFFYNSTLPLKADAKIKPISFTIQDKIQKNFRELICFDPLLHLGSAIAPPTPSLPLKAAANIQPNFNPASLNQKYFKLFLTF